MSRSVRRYDLAAVRGVLEAQGRDAALRLWPKSTVDPIARSLGLIARYRPSDNWKPEYVPLLGTQPDSVLAGMLSVPVSTIRAQRRRLGIPTADAKRFREARRVLLASIPDDDLAGPIDTLRERYGLQEYQLKAERRRRQVVGRRRRKPGLVDHYGAMRRVAVRAIKEAFPDVTLQEIGDVLDCTRERVRQILADEEAGVSGCMSTPTHEQMRSAVR